MNLADILTIRQTRARAQAEGLSISESALRQWVRSGAIPSRKAGKTFLLYYPNVERFLKCEDGGDMDAPKPAETRSGIRRVDL